MCVQVENGNDDWEVRLVARMLTALINAGVVAMTPVEKLIYDEHALFKLGTAHEKVPESFIEDLISWSRLTSSHKRLST